MYLLQVNANTRGQDGDRFLSIIVESNSTEIMLGMCVISLSLPLACASVSIGIGIAISND
jgi:hypothetical protein